MCIQNSVYVCGLYVIIVFHIVFLSFILDFTCLLVAYINSEEFSLIFLAEQHSILRFDFSYGNFLFISAAKRRLRDVTSVESVKF